MYTHACARIPKRGGTELAFRSAAASPPLSKAAATLPHSRISAFIDEKTAWRNTPSRTGNLKSDALIARLGFDPSLAQNYDLDDLAASLAAGSDCEDDLTWITRVYATIFQRGVTDPEMASLLAKRAKGDSRATIVRHLMKSPEVRAIVQGR